MRDQFVGDTITLDNALAFWVYRVSQLMRRELYRMFMRHGHDITPEQWIILVRLWERDGRLQNELSDSTVKDRPTISRALDVLEARGIAERRISSVDGRSRQVFLTPHGRQLRRKLVPLVRRLVDKIQDGLSESHLRLTRSTLKKMTDNLTGEAVTSAVIERRRRHPQSMSARRK